MGEQEIPKSGSVPRTESSNSQDETSDPVKRSQRRFEGWRAGARIWTYVAGSILLINIILTIVAAANKHHRGLATIQEGSCSKSDRLDLWLHFLINVFSTLLLVASNYCMQCLVAPTREDIDKAHAQHRWLDIGIPSMRNLRNIPRFRLLLWCLLAVSSVPLHLLYNSTVIATRSSQQYAIFVGSPALLSGEGVDWSTPVRQFRSYEESSDSPLSESAAINETNLELFRDISSWDRLSNDECIKAYFQSYIIGRGDVIALTASLNATEPLLHARDVTSFSTTGDVPQDWMCSAYQGARCSIKDLRAETSAWTLNDTVDVRGDQIYSAQYPIDSCLSQPVRERCTVQLSLIIVTVVIICNAVKGSCMLLMLWHQKSAPLVTIGDTIESFMLDSDETTKGMCWANKKTFINGTWEPSVKPWVKRRHYWFASASIRRWIICNTFSITTIITASVLFYLGLTALYTGQRGNLATSGFGSVNTLTMANWNSGGTSGILATALIANIPQLLISLLFLSYNGLYTCMLLANEWNGYADEKKPLRVTKPNGSQRSTYRLNLPYRYGIPLLITSILLHWLTHESLFLARITLYTKTGQEDPGKSISTVGYSCLPLLIVIVFGTVTVFFGLANGFRRFKPGIPLVGSCSAAISAACHVPEEDIHRTDKPVLWGVVSMNPDGVGHCSFTSLKVWSPIKGERYAGG